MAAKFTYRFYALIAACVLMAFSTKAQTSPSQNKDTSRPLVDRYGDPYTYPNRNTFDFKDTGFIKRSIEYDPVTRQYYIIEKIGDKYYRTPSTFTSQEFLRLQGRKDEIDYFRQRANLLSELNRRNFKPKFGFNKDWVNRITGNGKVEIKPNGYVDIAAGYQGQKIKNPVLPERARNTGGLDFNMNAQFQVDANIGDKIRLPINYNTLANFDYENQLKLDYVGKDDEILKQFQMGTINFASKGTLIPGAQSLFGVRTQLQFGKLFVTTALANQRSQRQSLGLQGGSASQSFDIRADEYEENRHFLMAQKFRQDYNKAMSQLPVVRSNFQILRVEVWVTNRTGATTDTRDVVGFMDLGEYNPFNPAWIPGPDTLPSNNASNLYQTLINAGPTARNSTQVQTYLNGLNGMRPVQDFEKTFARKLLPTDFYFNPQIGFVSLNQPLQPDEVLAVAYQYTYNGKVYQVGEFSQDVPPDSSGNSTKVLFLKLLKATSQRPNLPLWDLMMKNVYSVGFGQLERRDFKLDVFYEEPSLGNKKYLPPSITNDPTVLPGTPIIQLVNLDRLNNQNDPQPDGEFDYVEGFTVISSQSRIIFPVLEPFGRDLEYAVKPPDRPDFIYYPLYDTIKAIAQNYAKLNRYRLIGRSRSSGTNTDYQLGFNIPRGSVSVTAGGQILQENVDYEINYDLGTLRVINPAIISSGIPVQIQYENNATYGLQSKNFIGLRLDYLANKHLSLGATMVQLGERPFFTKQGYGEDPIRNRMYGIDFDYRNDVPRISKWLDKLPFYSTRATSSITAYGEAAFLDPGHAKQIGKGNEGAIFVDDFEGTRSSIDLRFPLISWTLASVPQNAPDINGNNLFPEGSLSDDLSSGYRRAKISWYNIEQKLQERRNNDNPLRNNIAELIKPETRLVYQSEIFPKRTNDIGQAILTTFDMAYYPRERGPYNFVADASRIDPNGRLTQPRQSWGGIMRNIDQTDFETSNIEFVEFWVQDPFINNRNPLGGELYFHLGNISEDVLRDGRRLYENGLPTPQVNSPVDYSAWGQVPRNPLQVTNAFSNDPADRPFQDAGFDGLTDTAERRHFANYLSRLGTVVNPTVLANAQNDPAGDNFKGYRDPSFTANDGILARYKNFNNPHGNSPIATQGDEFNAFTLYPDQEELNRDNTMNEVEEYFQYRIELFPGMDISNNPYITDVRRVKANLADGSKRDEKWYLFRIPVKDFQAKVGNIPDFKSIRFIRMFLTNFADTTVLRFGKLELVRNQWRKFTNEVDTVGLGAPLPAVDPVQLDVLAVNIEENDQRSPIIYRQPPGVERQQQLSNNNVQLLMNEQSLSIKVAGLGKEKIRGVFKTMNLDLRQYGRLSMFVHAESSNMPGNDLASGDISAVIRLGNDFTNNYYEIRIPLQITPWGARDSLTIWPEKNNLDFDLTELTQLKIRRNSSGANINSYYSELRPDGKRYAVFGNPNLGEVRGMFMGVENVRKEIVNAELWYDELRISKLNESGGWAALGRVDVRLADLGSLTLSGSYRSIGFGTLEQRVNERSMEDYLQYDATTSLDLGKLVPKQAALQIPVYAGVSKTISKPKYDPMDLDIRLKDKISNAPNSHDADSIRTQSIDETTIKTVNFTNVKKNKTNGKKPQLWDISNIDLNYNYVHQERTNPIIELEDIRKTRAAVGYNYAPQPTFVEPFKRMIKSQSPWFALIRDFNFNYKPSLISIKADVFRQFGATRSRNIGTSFKLPEFYNKFFYFDRYYNLRWDFTRSISFDFSAVNNARIDEPYGRIDTKEKKDTLKDRFWAGGRNTHYHHEGTLSYNLPTAKLPLLDWTTIRATYTAKYDWIAGSLIDRNLGNVLTNGQTRNLTSDLDFDRLYQKSKFLRSVYSESQDAKQRRQKPQRDSTGKKIKIRTPNQLYYVPTVPRTFAKIATSLKRISIQYTEDLGTLLPGYMDSTKVLGMNWRTGNPGWRYVLGYQPDTTAINSLGAKGLLSRDQLFNQLIQQRYNQHISATAQLSPLRDLNIDITVDRVFDKNYSELYKDTAGFGLSRLNPYATGSFSMSYISYQTLFEDFDPNQISETFRRFEANRVTLSNRLSKLNPDPQNDVIDPSTGYYKGYGRYAQDVLIPAFLAAYTNKDPNSVQLIKNSNPNLRANPFSRLLPRPNWNITFNGLTRIKGLEKIFTNFTLRHGYNSTLSMNSFNTALLFQDFYRAGYPSFIDTVTNSYVPYFLVPNISITEQFAPLIGVDATFTNQLSARFEYKKSRTLSLSLLDYQLAENHSTEFTIGADWRRRGVPIFQNIKIGKNGKKLDNDITFRFDYSMRDDATANTKLDQNTAFGTAGQKVVRLAPSIDYVVNNRVNLKFYYEQNKVIPKIATTAPITTTRAGVQIRISLAQ